MDYKFKYNFLRIAPRKVRLVVDLVRKLSITDAINQLSFLPKYAATPVKELIKSAVTSCKEQDINENNLYIKSIVCDEGPALKRRVLRSRGRASQVKKRTSHITLVLSEKEVKETKKTKTTTKKDK